MTFLDRLNSPNFDITQKRSGSKIVKFQQSQALTSQFESFWSIVWSYLVLMTSTGEANRVAQNPAITAAVKWQGVRSSIPWAISASLEAS